MENTSRRICKTVSLHGTDKAFSLFHALYASGESKRETQWRCDYEQCAVDDIGIFRVPSTLSLHGEIVQSSSAGRTPLARRTPRIDSSR